MDQASNPRPIWVPSPDRVAQSVMTAFRGFAMERSGEAFPDGGHCMPGRCRRPQHSGKRSGTSSTCRARRARACSCPSRTCPRRASSRTPASALRRGAARGAGPAEEDAIVFADEAGAGRRWSWDRLRRRQASRRPRGRGWCGRPRRGPAAQHPRGGGGDAGPASRSVRCGRRPRRTSGFAACLTASGRSRPRC